MKNSGICKHVLIVGLALGACNGGDATIDPPPPGPPDPGAPPDTRLLTTPDVMSNQPEARFVFDSVPNGMSFRCSLDQGQAFACSSPYLTNVAEGDHHFEVTAVDAQGQADPTPVAYAWRVDTQPPNTTIDSAPPAHAATSDAIFTFESTELGTFMCSLDAQPAKACASPTSYVSLTVASHTFTVTAVDQAGNADPTPATYTWSVDTSTPHTNISGPPKLTAQTTGSFILSVTPADPNARYECSLDAPASWVACSASYRTPVLGDGPHTLWARAINQAGTVDPNPPQHDWTIDTKGPDTIGDTLPASKTGRNVTISYHSEPGATFVCKLDAGSEAACSATQNLTSLADGLHTFVVYALDTLQNQGAPLTITWTVDATGPQVTLAVNAAISLGVGRADVTATSSEKGTIDCSVDGAKAVDCTAVLHLYELAPGAHSVTATAHDTFGNTGTPASQSFWILLGTGNAVWIGHDFFSADLDTGVIAGNAVALAPAASFKRGVRIVGYEGKGIDLGERDAALKLTLNQLSRRGVAATYTGFTDPKAFAKAVAGNDVLLVFDQQDAATADALGKLWGSALVDFLKSGGVVIVLDGMAADRKTPSQSYLVLSSSGVLLASFNAPVVAKTAISITKAGLSDKVMSDYGAPTTYPATDFTVTIKVADSGAVMLWGTTIGPVVLKKTI